MYGRVVGGMVAWLQFNSNSANRSKRYDVAWKGSEFLDEKISPFVEVHAAECSEHRQINVDYLGSNN